MDNRGDADVLIVLVIVALAFVYLAVKYISDSIGADINSTGYALLMSGIIGVLAIIGFYKGLLSNGLIGSAALFCLWLSWCPVISSIAHGGNSKDDFSFMFIENPWWNSSYLKWGIGLFLFGCVIYFYRRSKKYYGSIWQ